MHKHILALGAITAIALSAAVVAGLNPHRQVIGGSQSATISTEDLHRQVDAASLPVTFIAEPY